MTMEKSVESRIHIWQHTSSFYRVSSSCSSLPCCLYIPSHPEYWPRKFNPVLVHVGLFLCLSVVLGWSLAMVLNMVCLGGTPVKGQILLSLPVLWCWHLAHPVSAWKQLVTQGCLSFTDVGHCSSVCEVGGPPA